MRHRLVAIDRRAVAPRFAGTLVRQRPGAGYQVELGAPDAERSMHGRAVGRVGRKALVAQGEPPAGLQGEPGPTPVCGVVLAGQRSGGNARIPYGLGPASAR
jgi:hypothetical protein